MDDDRALPNAPPKHAPAVRSACRHDVAGLQRYLLAVNVMTASVLRGVVETALSDLLDFFRIHATVAATASGTNQGSPGDSDTQSSRPRRSGGGSGSSGGTGDGGSGAGGGRETRREHGGLGDGTRGGGQDEEQLLHGCLPLFKVTGSCCLLALLKIFYFVGARRLSSLSEQLRQRLRLRARSSPSRGPIL